MVEVVVYDSPRALLKALESIPGADSVETALAVGPLLNVELAATKSTASTAADAKTDAVRPDADAQIIVTVCEGGEMRCAGLVRKYQTRS